MSLFTHLHFSLSYNFFRFVSSVSHPRFLFFDHDDYEADHNLCQPFKQNCRESSCGRCGLLENTTPLSTSRKWATAITETKR
jgi:hypothetical protein